MIKNLFKNFEISKDEKERFNIIKEFENQFEDFSSFVKKNYKHSCSPEIRFRLPHHG